MFKVKILFVVILMIFMNCKGINNQNKFVENSEIHDKNKSVNFSKSKPIKLNSAIYNPITDTLEIKFSVQYQSNNRIFIPVNSEFPILSTKNDERIKMEETSGLVIKWFQNNIEINPTKSFPVPLGHIPPIDNQTWEDSIWLENIYEPYWERKSLIEKERLKSKNKEFKNTFNWFFRRKYLIDNNNIFSPRETRNFITKIAIKNYTQKFHNRYSYDLKSLIQEVDSIQLSIVSDSILLKDSLLLDKDINSLRANKIKIFHGNLESNKVPIIFDKKTKKYNQSKSPPED